MVGLAAESAEHKTIMIDATYLKAHRTASSLGVKKGGADARLGEPRAGVRRLTVSSERTSASATFMPGSTRAAPTWRG